MSFTWGDTEERAQMTVTWMTGHSPFESQCHASDKQRYSLQPCSQSVREKVSYLIRAQEARRKCLVTAFLTDREANDNGQWRLVAAPYKPLQTVV